MVTFIVHSADSEIPRTAILLLYNPGTDMLEDRPATDGTTDAPFKNYLCAVGAAIAVTIFDGIQNSDAAALKKAGFWFSNHFSDGKPAAHWAVAALLFFALFSALMVLAYKPRATKEAFLLGVGVLALLNSFIKPPTAQRNASNIFMTPAFAQQDGSGNQEIVDIWFLINGPASISNPGISLTIYPANAKGTVFRQMIRPIDNIKLLPGRYHFEFSHNDHRSIVFSADIGKTPVAFTKLFMRSTGYDTLANLFGPEAAKPRVDFSLATALKSARAQCEIGDTKAAAQSLVEVRPEDHLKLYSDDITKKGYCVKQRQ